MSTLSACERGSSAARMENAGSGMAAIPVTVTPVRTQKLQRTVEFVATLHANEEVTVSSEVEGRIASTKADLGDRVDPGYVLARIDDGDFRLAVEQAESSLKEALAKLGAGKVPPANFDVTETSLVMKAKAELDNAEAHLKRMKTLFDEKVISAQEYDDAETRYKTAMAAYRNSVEEATALVAAAHSREAQLDTAKRKLKNTAVRAPLSGTISKRWVSPGEYVKVGIQLFTIVQDHPIKIRGMVPERFAPRVRPGQAVEARVDSFPGQPFKGRLVRISPSVEVASRSFLVEGLIDNPRRSLKPGSFAKAAISTHIDPEAITVPQQALLAFAGVTKVFVVENDVAKERVVETGARAGRDEVEITAGLKPGELVVISGLSRLTDGAPVKVSGPVMPRERQEDSGESR